jgi:hypothetical protein
MDLSVLLPHPELDIHPVLDAPNDDDDKPRPATSAPTTPNLTPLHGPEPSPESPGALGEDGEGKQAKDKKERKEHPHAKTVERLGELLEKGARAPPPPATAAFSSLLPPRSPPRDTPGRPSGRLMVSWAFCTAGYDNVKALPRARVPIVKFRDSNLWVAPFALAETSHAVSARVRTATSPSTSALTTVLRWRTRCC